MKIKMLMSISGVGFALARGDETERFSEKDAHNLINSGAAVLLPVIAYETAVTANQTTETAVAALNVAATGHDGGEGGQEPTGSPETGTENTGAVGDVDDGSGEQPDATQSASGKGKGKAS